MKKILLEICVDSIESARAAKKGGADRLEVCGPLAVGGTTPSWGFVQQCVADVRLPVMMMIRPHNGGFDYTDDDIVTMRADIEAAKSIGVQGVVFGALTADQQIDQEHCQLLLDIASPLQTTFHRAFDVVADPLTSLDTIIRMGFDRLLTSGQAITAERGIPLIRQLHDRAQGRIGLVAGAGVNAQNARQIVDATGVRELHASAGRAHDRGQSNNQVAFGTSQHVTSADAVQAIQQALAMP